MNPNKSRQNARYTNVAVFLHWVIAIAVFAMLGSGLSLDLIPMDRMFEFRLIQWHKSLGVLVLAAVAARLAWRIFHTPPPLPAHIRKIEAFAAKTGHWALYALLVVMPLSGWIMVSSSVFGLPTIVFGWFEWPHIPGIAGKEDLSNTALTIHETAAWILLALVAGHIAAVVKHAMIDHENLLPRMWFGKDK